MIDSQANRDSQPHLIGGYGELVWEGDFFSDNPVSVNVVVLSAMLLWNEWDEM